MMSLSFDTHQQLLDELAEAVVLIEGGRVTLINQAASKLLGINSESAVGLPPIAVLRDHRLEHAYLHQVAIECETRGRVVEVMPIAGGLRIRDLTDLKRTQESARELLAVLSHELRTPVATIRSTLEALRSDVPDDLRARFLQRAEAECLRLVRLLDDLTVDVKPPQYRSVFVPDVVARAVSLVQQTFQDHRVCLKQQVEPLTVWADSDKLLQILINLLENAAIHGPDDATVTLRVSRCQVDPDYQPSEAVIDAQDCGTTPCNEMVCISVTDAGEPLDTGTIAQLFEPHARGASAKAKGTGLGLYIVKSISERWGGRAWGQPLAHGNRFGVTVRHKA